MRGVPLLTRPSSIARYVGIPWPLRATSLLLLSEAFACVCKVRPDGAVKCRIIMDSRESTVTEAIRKEASFIGLNVTAGELVGLVPLEAMLSAGRFYIDDDSIVDEKVLVQKAISGLMLDMLDDFEPESSIIEWAIKKVV